MKYSIINGKVNVGTTEQDAGFENVFDQIIKWFNDMTDTHSAVLLRVFENSAGYLHAAYLLNCIDRKNVSEAIRLLISIMKACGMVKYDVDTMKMREEVYTNIYPSDNELMKASMMKLEEELNDAQSKEELERIMSLIYGMGVGFAKLGRDVSKDDIQRIFDIASNVNSNRTEVINGVPDIIEYRLVLEPDEED